MEVLGRALRASDELRTSREVFQQSETLDNEKSSKQKKVSKKKKEPKHYLLLLKEYGFPLNLICSEAENIKGKLQGNLCVQRTLRLSGRSSKTGDPALRSRFYDVYDDVWRAVYTLLLGNPPNTKSRGASSDINTSSSSANVTQDHRLLGVAIAAPGTGKTRSVIDTFSRLRHVHLRVGLAGSRVDELLYYEYLINCLFPQGSSIPDGDPSSLPDPYLPSLAQQHAVWTKLPESIKKSFADEESIFLKRVTNARSFFINTHHPSEVDERLTWSGDEDVFKEGKKKLPPWATGWNDPSLYNPFAVLKFQARQDLCVAGFDKKQLQDRQVCKDCLFVSCRANTHQQEQPDKDEPVNRLLEGTKLYWRRANVPLLTHAAFRIHSALSPDLNHFDGLVFDEIPEKVVYRVAKISVSPDTNARANWTLDIQDRLRRVLKSLLQVDDEKRVEAEEICAKLESARSRLAHLGQKLRREVQAEKRSSYEFKVETDFEPLLGFNDFKKLVRITRGVQELDEDDDEQQSSDLSSELRDLLLTLRDFCGAPGELLSVYLEHTFDKNGEGELWVHRPVNGWPEVLDKPDGTPRPTIILDASAGLDPRYQLLNPGGDEQVPRRSYPNTTVVFYQDKTEWLGKARSRDEQYRIGLLKEVVEPYLTKLAQATSRDYSALKLLLLTNKGDRLHLELAWQQAVRLLRSSDPAALPSTTVDHFGRLRGSNAYRDFDAVFFANLFARHGDEYVGLDLLLRNFEDYPKQWESKNVEAWKHNWELTRSRSMVAEIYQDALRIGLRSSPERPCLIFLPTKDQRFVARIMRCFRDATFVLPGDPVPEKLKGGPIPSRRPKGASQANVPSPADDEPVFGEPPYHYDEPAPFPAAEAMKPGPPPSQSEIDDAFGPARYEGTEEDTAEVAPGEFLVTDYFKEEVLHVARTLAREQRVRLPEDEGRNDLERVASDWRRSNPGRSPEDLDTMDWAERLIEMHRHPREQELARVLEAVDELLSAKAKDRTHFREMARAVRDRVRSEEMLAILDAVPKDDPELLAQRPYTAASQIIAMALPE
jgi:hypothetical protein